VTQKPVGWQGIRYIWLCVTLYIKYEIVHNQSH